jgi:uncharacterized membrane protein YfcA
MQWQDMVMSLGGFFVAATLLPMLRAPMKPPLSTSAPLIVTLAAITVALYTLDLRLAAAGTAVQCVVWFAMLIAARRPVPVRISN